MTAAAVLQLLLAGIGAVALAMASWALRRIIAVDAAVGSLDARVTALEESSAGAKRSRGTLFDRVTRLETAREVDAEREAAKIARSQIAALEAENARWREMLERARDARDALHRSER